MKSIPYVGQFFSTPEEFRAYALSVKPKMAWKPEGICFHHTAEPSLSMRPKGFLSVHMGYMAEGYAARGFKAGPHLFTDDRGIWVLSPLVKRGTHAVLFNADHFGIETLGDYDGVDNPNTGRGAECWQNTFRAALVLREVFGTLRVSLHRDDPAAQRIKKTCPGTSISRQFILDGLAQGITAPPREWSLCVEGKPVGIELYEVNHKNFVVFSELAMAVGMSMDSFKNALSVNGGVLEYKDVPAPTAYYNKEMQATLIGLREGAKLLGYSVFPDGESRVIDVRKFPPVLLP